MRPAATKRLQRIALGALLPAVALVAWQLISTMYPVVRSVMSSPYEVVLGLARGIATGQTFQDVGWSLMRALGGWALACITAAPLGILMARNRIARTVLGAPLNLLRAISPVAWIPVAILWFGIGYESKVFIVGIVSFFVVLANTFQVAEAIDPVLLKAARTFTQSRLRVAVYVILPASVRGIATGAQYALASAWGGVIIAEYTGASSGVGYQMLNASNLFLPAGVMAGMVIVAAVGYLLNVCFTKAMTSGLARKYVER